MKPTNLVIGVTVLVLAVYFPSAVDGTRVTSCKGDPKAVNGNDPIPDDVITVSNCTKLPCRLRRKTKITVIFRFKPTRDIATLQNDVHALILNIPFPFLGVDRTPACNQIYLADGTTKAPCPLKAGTEFVYKNAFDILDIYPKIRLIVHWALVADDGSKPVCFNVPAKITS